MSDRPLHETEDADDAFAKRISRPLRAPEQLNDDFEVRLASVLRASSARRDRERRVARPWSAAWWQTPRSLSLSPLATLALAASCTAIISLSTLGLARRLPGRATATPAAIVGQTVHDTVNVVRFVFVDKQAKTVSLVGDFNAWSPQSTPLTATGEHGAWTASVALPEGRYEYAFIVDGKRWTPDPFAPASSDDFNTTSSVIEVGTN